MADIDRCSLAQAHRRQVGPVIVIILLHIIFESIFIYTVRKQVSASIFLSYVVLNRIKRQIKEVKIIITRAGENTKVVFSGDIFQTDPPHLNTQSKELSYLIEKMHGQKLYAHINLEKGEHSELSELTSNLL